MWQPFSREFIKAVKYIIYSNHVYDCLKNMASSQRERSVHARKLPISAAWLTVGVVASPQTSSNKGKGLTEPADVEIRLSGYQVRWRRGKRCRDSNILATCVGRLVMPPFQRS